ncbi:MAG: hypothetical protein M0R20_01730 [Candidatus Omnitrophica bacterium]|jgi:hypothetical protein|nr:hypothetical protein [Candidatus Omnitrophota bacterium]
MRHIVTGISRVTAEKNQELICLEESMRRALIDSNIEITDNNRSNIGIFLGTTFSNFCIRKNNFDKLDKLGMRAVNPADFPRLLISYLGGCLSIKFGTKGALGVLSSGQSSGLDALQQALFFLQRDKKNIAFVIDLDESWEEKKSFMANGSVCFVCENMDSKTRRKVYAEILRIESFFEKKNKISGICKCIQKTLEFCLPKKAASQYFYSSQPLNNRKYILENNALQYIYKDKKNKLFPAKNTANSSLKVLYDNLKSKIFVNSRQNNLPISLFLNIGNDANSICVATRIFKATLE